jgi:hypothetical protein
VAAIFARLLRVLALDPVRDLVRSVDRMPIRSLLQLVVRELQPDFAWTINRERWAPNSNAEGVGRMERSRTLGSNEHTLSRAPHVAESPTRRISATYDETRIIDQCGATRDARRDSGGRRAS